MGPRTDGRRKAARARAMGPGAAGIRRIASSILPLLYVLVEPRDADLNMKTWHPPI